MAQSKNLLMALCRFVGWINKLALILESTRIKNDTKYIY